MELVPAAHRQAASHSGLGRKRYCFPVIAMLGFEQFWSSAGVLCKPPIAYNTPMRTLFSTVAAILLVGALLMEAQAPKGPGKGGGKKGGGFMPKNLQVLDRASFPAAMQSFVQALGLLDQGGCNYCHVDDRASDEKMQKVIAPT
jgi:hypothetical protein